MKNNSHYNSKSSNKYWSLLSVKFYVKHFREYKDEYIYNSVCREESAQKSGYGKYKN